METTDATFADVPDDKAAIAVMSEVGDTKYIWDPTNPAEVEGAKEQFERMKEKGFLVFKLTPYLHRKGKEVKKFHPQGKGYLFTGPEKPKADGKLVKDVKKAKKGDRFIATPPVAGG